MSKAAKPLAGLRVLDFGHTIMGPCAGHVMADLGADVIKIESVEGDPTRRLPGFASGFFATFNRNKRSVAVDLKSEAGRAIVHRLVKDADVVLENFGPGTIERLDCGWETLSAVNPRLIFLTMKGFLAGPYEHRGALDEVVQMQSGLAYMTGPPGRPLRAGAPIVDILGGVFGVVAALAALRERDVTGRGQRVSSSLFESAVFLLASMMAGSAVTGQPMPPMPARKSAWGVYDVFNARGGQVFIGITNDPQWHRFCDAFGFKDWRDAPHMQGNARRCDAREWLLPELQQRLDPFDMGDILERCEAANIPFARVGRPDELAADPHLAAGGLLNVALGALGGGVEVGLPALPLEFGDDRVRPGLETQPPRLGEHTRAILAASGYSAQEIEAFATAGVIAR
ncbi:CaiB/BaiF CoA-transferase family protein [Rhabdaerophilum sp. SD176]|uniref:CaiB/BaiF CoA transferase family protein n=1 Tax=Rhabdaerophilum sp. SD176 TaxID=2983548 RepID=UPI0024DF8B7C|nr:CaiB/BaiF CoA-transferase family protein [Rhabdaerophilum sp. SD176]